MKCNKWVCEEMITCILYIIDIDKTQISKIMESFEEKGTPYQKFDGVGASEGLVIGLENQLLCVFSAVSAQNCFWFN